MIPIAQQLEALNTYTRRNPQSEAKLEQILDVFHKEAGNLQIATVATRIGLVKSTTAEYMRELVCRGQLVSWKVGRNAWYALSASELMKREEK